MSILDADNSGSGESEMLTGVGLAPETCALDYHPLRVVVVDEEIPYPADSGKRIRSLNLLLPLAARHRITYMAHAGRDAEETRRGVDYLASRGIECVVVDRPVPVKSGARFYGRLALNLLSPLPYSVEAHASEAMQDAIRRHAARHATDLWHCEWTPYAENVRRIVAEPWLVMAHNVESLIWQRYHETERQWLRRWYIKQQWRKFERFERDVFGEAGLVVAVSEQDARLARERFDAPRVEVVDNGVDVSHFTPDGSPRDPRCLLFVGALDWRPNLDAVRLLLDQVFPRVQSQAPEARLMLVGRKPAAWIADRVRGLRGVSLHGDVPDVRPFLRQSGMLAVPLRVGGGSRLKILEALAAECPVVSTRIGAEGLELEPGRHIVQVEGVEDMAAALVHAMRNPGPMRQMASLGRELVRRRYDWSILAEKLETLWLRSRCPKASAVEATAAQARART